MNTRSFISAILLLLIGTHLFAVGIENSELVHWTKPVLMPVLALYFWLSSKEVAPQVRWGVLIALVFSWLGDSLLMYQGKSEIYFLSGLGAFLVAQVLYALNFRHLREKTKKGMEWRTKFSVAILSLFYVFMIYTFWNFLGELKLPVIIYGACLVGMVIMATIRKNRTNETSFSLLFFGAIAFLMSDCMLAVTKFVGAFPLSQFWVMVTYLAAQVLIVQGVLSHYIREAKPLEVAKAKKPATRKK